MIGRPDEIVQWLFKQDRDKLFEITEKKEKRSLNANSYFWCLVGKIADALRTSKDEVYLTMLKRYGQSEMVSVVSSVDVTGYFKYYEEVARTHLQGKEFVHYRIFKGSSEYNTQEMAVLIDGIISEAQEMDIETLPPQMVERLKEMWNG